MLRDLRAAVLCAALGFLSLEVREAELTLLHGWLDSWRGIGDVVVGMHRQAYSCSSRSTAKRGWRAAVLNDCDEDRPGAISTAQFLTALPSPRRDRCTEINGFGVCAIRYARCSV